MTSPGGDFGQIERFSDILQIDDLLEQRFENDSDQNPIYIGYSVTPNASESDAVWYILKVEYVSQGVVRKRLPDDGIGFIYVWEDRADYFA